MSRSDRSRLLEWLRRTRHQLANPHARRAASRLPELEPLPPVSESARHRCDIPEMRSVTASEPLLVADACAVGNASIRVLAPEDSGQWKVSGRAWCANDPCARIRIALVHEDHVFQSVEVVSGERFDLSELMPVGWALEVRYDSGDTLVFEDPTRG